MDADGSGFHIGILNTLHSDERSVRWVGHKMIIEVERPLQIIIGGRRNSACTLVYASRIYSWVLASSGMGLAYDHDEA